MSSSSVRVVIPPSLARRCVLTVAGRPAIPGEDVPVEPGRHAVELRGELVVGRRLVALQYRTSAAVPRGGAVTVAPAGAFGALLGG